MGWGEIRPLMCLSSFFHGHQGCESRNSGCFVISPGIGSSRFCSHLWICCHFGFGVGDDALFLRVVARVVVYCWLENLNGYCCYHVFVFCFLAGSLEFVMLVGSPFSGRWEIRSWEFSQPVDPSEISADIFSLTLFEETTSQMLSCNGTRNWWV